MRLDPKVALLAFAFALLLPAPLFATVPRVDRVMKAVVEANRSDGRQDAVRLELKLSIDDRQGVANAELISLPQGLARLELRGAGGLVERHLLQGPELLVSRNGEMLTEHRAFLPPFFMLQAESDDSMRAALQSFGIREDVVGLAACGQEDCLVVGDPRRAIEMPPPRPIAGISDEERGERALEQAGLGAFAVLDGGPGSDVPDQGADANPDRGYSKIWIDRESYEIRGIDSAAGVKIRFGPLASFDDLRVPAWITIEEPSRGPARFDVVRASKVSAPASAFTPAWLTSPIVPDDGPEPSAPADAAALSR